MVSLPDPNQFLGATTKPVQANLSGAEVASPYVEIARSLDKGGEALNSYAIEEAKKAGEAAGQQARVDDNGNIIMDKAPFYMGQAAPEYRRAATMSAAMKMEPQIQNKALELRLQHANDPEGYKQAMSEYQSTLVDKIDDPHLKAGINNMVATSAAQNYRTSLTETNNNNNREFLFNSTNKIKEITDQMHSLDRQGAGYDPSGKRPPSKEYLALAASRMQIADEIVGHKELGISQGRMDDTLKEMIDQGKVQAVIGDVQREYKDKSNLVAAKAALMERFWGPEGEKLKLSPRQRDAAVAEGIKSLNYLDAADRAAIRDNARAVSEHINRISKNPELWDPSDHQQWLDDSRALGDKNSVHALETLPIRVDWNKYFRTLSDKDKAEALVYTSRGQFPPGFHPSGAGLAAPLEPSLMTGHPLGGPPGAIGQQTGGLMPGPVAPRPTPREEIPGLTVPAEGGPAGPGPRAAGPAASQPYGGVPQSFVDKIKGDKIEGFDPVAKWDYQQFTYGHGAKAPYAGAQISREGADKLLDRDLRQAAAVVDRVNPNLDPGTRAALTSLTFNAGEKWTSGTLGQQVRAGDLTGAKLTFLQYEKAGGSPLQALRTRRAEEASWFGATEAPPGPAAVAGGQPGTPIRGMLPGNPMTPRMVSSVLSDTITMTKPMAEASYKSVIDKLKDGNPLGEGEAELAVNTNHIIGEEGKVEELLTKMQAAQAAGLVKPGEYQSVRDQVQIAMGTGLPRAQYNLAKDIETSIAEHQKERRENAPVYLSKTFGTSAPNPINVSNPLAAVGEAQARGKALEIGQGLDPALGPTAVFGKEEAKDISGQLQTADGGQVASVLGGLRAAIPNDGNYLATVDRLKEPIIALSRSPDPVKMGAGFSAMAMAYDTNPAVAKQIFDEANIDRMEQFKVLHRYMLPDELVEHFNKADVVDSATRKARIEEVEKDLVKLKGDDVAYYMSSAWPVTPAFISRLTGTQGYAPPTGSGALKQSVNANDELIQDYKRTVRAYVVSGVTLDKAKEIAADKLKSTWQPSAVAGGTIMRNAPELFYDKDKVMDNHDWMISDMNKFMADRLGPDRQMVGEPLGEIGGFLPQGDSTTGRNWKFQGLVSDAQTEREAQDPKRRPDGSVIKPSYRIAYTNAKGQIKFLPDRIAWEEGTLESVPHGPELEPNAPAATAATGALGTFQTRQRKAMERQQVLEERARSEFQPGP